MTQMCKDKFFIRRRRGLDIKARDLVLRGQNVKITIIYSHGDETAVFRSHPHLENWPIPLREVLMAATSQTTMDTYPLDPQHRGMMSQWRQREGLQTSCSNCRVDLTGESDSAQHNEHSMTQNVSSGSANRAIVTSMDGHSNTGRGSGEGNTTNSTNANNTNCTATDNCNGHVTGLGISTGPPNNIPNGNNGFQDSGFGSNMQPQHSVMQIDAGSEMFGNIFDSAFLSGPQTEGQPCPASAPGSASGMAPSMVPSMAPSMAPTIVPRMTPLHVKQEDNSEEEIAEEDDDFDEYDDDDDDDEEDCVGNDYYTTGGRQRQGFGPLPMSSVPAPSDLYSHNNQRYSPKRRRTENNGYMVPVPQYIGHHIQDNQQLGSFTPINAGSNGKRRSQLRHAQSTGNVAQQQAPQASMIRPARRIKSYDHSIPMMTRTRARQRMGQQ